MSECDKCRDYTKCNGKRDGSCSHRKEHGNTSEGVCERRKIRKISSGGIAKTGSGGSFTK